MYELMEKGVAVAHTIYIFSNTAVLRSQQQLEELLNSQEAKQNFAILSQKWRELRESVPPATYLFIYIATTALFYCIAISYAQLKQNLQVIASEITDQFPTTHQLDDMITDDIYNTIYSHNYVKLPGL